MANREPRTPSWYSFFEVKRAKRIAPLRSATLPAQLTTTLGAGTIAEARRVGLSRFDIETVCESIFIPDRANFLKDFYD